MQKEQELVKDLTKAWEAKGEWLTPTLSDSVQFMVTEAAEAMEARLRMETRYVRNNPRDGGIAEIAVECVDTIFMAFITLNLIGVDAQAAFLQKLYHMDGKRLASGRKILYEYSKRE